MGCPIGKWKTTSGVDEHWGPRNAGHADTHVGIQRIGGTNKWRLITFPKMEVSTGRLKYFGGRDASLLGWSGQVLMLSDEQQRVAPSPKWGLGDQGSHPEKMTFTSYAGSCLGPRQLLVCLLL